MRLALLGDIALFGSFDVNNNPHLEENLKGISSYLDGFDYVVGNLETPFSEKKKKHGAKSSHICSDVRNIDVLKWLHVDAVTLANNHMFDYGDEGYNTTIKLLQQAGIEYFGTDGKPLKITLDGNKLLFNGCCCYSTNPLNMASRWGKRGINKLNVEAVESLLRNNKDYLNIIAVHAGIEHVNYPSADHIKLSQRLASIAPFVYYGHHPHVIQGVEKYKGSIIAHSLGNFCFDDIVKETGGLVLSENNRTGIILELEINNNKVDNWRETPFYIERDGRITILKQYTELENYNNFRRMYETNPAEYDTARMSTINSYIAKRKSQRNLKWYLDRMRPMYARLLFDNHNNLRLYNKNISRYL